MDKYEHLFLYSGLKRRFPSITVEIWSVCILLSSAGAYGVALLIGEDWFLGIPAMAGDIFILLFLEMLLAMKNYKTVDSDLMEFLNLLRNFKELISSIEVCARYSADFSLVVSNSRKIIQDAARARNVEAFYPQLALGSLRVVKIWK